MLLQVVLDSATTAAAATTAATVAPSLSLFDLLLSGGWVMIPIGILSVLAIYFTIERYLVISRAAKVDPNFMNNIRTLLLDNKSGRGFVVVSFRQTRQLHVCWKKELNVSVVR